MGLLNIALGLSLWLGIGANCLSQEGPRAWPEYRTILWIGENAGKTSKTVLVERLREMGINSAMVYGDADPEPWVRQDFPYYVENIVNRGLCLKFHSKVTDWDKFVTNWSRTGRPDSGLVRDYSLDDPEWRDWAREQMQTVARKNAPHQPLAYDIRDELSTTISANPFDFDFSPKALAGFRDWLKTQYADLPALNAEWDTKFAAWDDVPPFTTDQVKQRMATGTPLPAGKPDWAAVQAVRFNLADARNKPTAWNFAPWADFRSYMDLSLARVLDELRSASRELDPATPVGIEGTQMPHAFGGYDLWRLSQVLDWVEPYDIGNSREIFGSFMPGKTLMTTVFETETNPASRRLWHLLLEGDRGCIIWWSEDCIDWNSPGLPLTRKAKALQSVLHEMTSKLANLFLKADRQHDPVFIHYSQASIQADWLIESTVDGSTWLRRFSSFEADHNRQAKERNSWLKLFQDLGFSPRFISTAQIEAGALRKQQKAALVLPSSWALSEMEAAEIRAFAQRPGGACRVFFNGTPGVFDAHCRLTGRSALEEYLPSTPSRNRAVATDGKTGIVHERDIADYALLRLKGEPAAKEWREWAQRNLGELRPEVSAPLDACVRVHRLRHSIGRLLAFERNIDYLMSEDLKQAGGNEPLEKPISLEVPLPAATYVYDLCARKPLGKTNRLQFVLDPWRPSLFLLTETAEAALRWAEAASATR